MYNFSFDTGNMNNPTGSSYFVNSDGTPIDNGLGQFNFQGSFPDSLFGSNLPNSSNTTPMGTQGSSFASGLGAVAGGLQALGGLANAYLGYKNYQLAKKQFGFQKGLANRNLANQAKIINNTYDNAAQVAAGMIGGKDASGNYGFTDQAIVDDYAKKAKEKHVDGSAI